MVFLNAKNRRPDEVVETERTSGSLFLSFRFKDRAAKWFQKTEPEVINKRTHLVRPWISKDSSVQVFPPFSSSSSSSSFSRTLFFGCCVGGGSCPSQFPAFSSCARGNINCCEHHYCGGAEMEKNDEEALDLLLSLQSEDDDAASNDVRDGKGPRGRHSSSPSPPPPCDDAAGMLSPVTPCGSSWCFFLSDWFFFGIFIVASYPGQFYCCFREIAHSFLVLFLPDSFSVLFLSHTYPVQFYCCFRKIACSFLVLFLSDSFSVVLLSHTYFVQLILLLLVAFFWQNFFVFFFSGLVWRFYCILRMVTRRDYSRSCRKLMIMTFKSIISEHLCYFFDLERSMKWASLLQQRYIFIAKEFKRDFVMNCTVNNNAVCVCMIVKNERRLKEFSESDWGMLWSSHAIYLPVFGLPFDYGNLQSVERKKLELDSVWMTLAGCKPGLWNKTKPGSSMRRFLLPNHWPRYLTLNLIQVSLFSLSVVPPLFFRMWMVWKCLRKWREHHCLVKNLSVTQKAKLVLSSVHSLSTSMCKQFLSFFTLAYMRLWSWSKLDHPRRWFLQGTVQLRRTSLDQRQM